MDAPSRHPLTGIYLCVMATITTIILAAILVMLIYGGLKIRAESKAVSQKISNFNSQITKINDNLKGIELQLQTAKSVTGL